MVDVCQWRESIGVWCCHQILCARGAVKASTTTSKMHNLRTSAIVISLVLLLALSGDIEPNPGPKTGTSPSEVLRIHSANLINAVTPNLHQVTAALHAHKLITLETVDEMMTMGLPNLRKANRLILVMQQSLKGNLNPEHYLVEVCQVLQSEKDNVTLTEIATLMLQELENFVQPKTCTVEEQVEESVNDVQLEEDPVVVDSRNRTVEEIPLKISIYQKKPLLNDVYHLLKAKSANWNDVGRELHVPMDYRDGLLQDKSLNTNDCLEKVLNYWLEKESHPPVTWSGLIHILNYELKYKDIVGEIQTFLDTEQAAE